MTAVERYNGAEGTVATFPGEREWAQMERMAAVFARSSMCPSAFREKPEEIMVAALSLRALDVPLTLNTLNQCYVIDGHLSMMAQLQVAVAARNGYEVWFVKEECDDAVAVVHIQAPGKLERTMDYTLEEAADAGLLDEWVEKWQTTSNGKRYAERVVVSVNGQRVATALPDWAENEVKAGRIKRKDPWFKARRSMLMARAVTKGLRYLTPHILLGLGDPEFDAPTVIDAEVGEEQEIPAAPAAIGAFYEAPATAGREVTPEDEAPAEPHVNNRPAQRRLVADPVRKALRVALEGLPEAQREQVEQLAAEAEIPHIDRHELRPSHVETLKGIISAVRLEDQAKAAVGIKTGPDGDPF